MQVVLLSGGSGKRLWPLSNDARSKQFLHLLAGPSGEKESMVQRVVRQLKSTIPAAEVTFATNASQRDCIINQLGEYAKYNKVVVEATAIPAQIVLTQDDRTLNIQNVVKVYDAYGNSDGHTSYGTKIGVNLTLSSGTVSSKIKDENKLVKVYISDSANSGLEISKYFELYDSQSRRWGFR